MTLERPRESCPCAQINKSCSYFLSMMSSSALPRPFVGDLHGRRLGYNVRAGALLESSERHHRQLPVIPFGATRMPVFASGLIA